MPLEGVSTAMCVSAIADVGVFQLFVIVNGACFHKTSRYMVPRARTCRDAPIRRLEKGEKADRL
jgi:hypothetical protein